MFLLNEVDLTPNEKIVSCAQIGEEGYAENELCTLHLISHNNGIEAFYVSESGAILTSEQFAEAVKLAESKV